MHSKALEQVHICLGVPGIPQNDPDRYAAHVLTQALGGGMSSRLFQEIRERRGKAYTVFSFLPTFHDSGYLGVYVGTSAGWAREVVDVVRAEFAALADKGLRPEELARTKAQIKAILVGIASKLHPSMKKKTDPMSMVCRKNFRWVMRVSLSLQSRLNSDKAADLIHYTASVFPFLSSRFLFDDMIKSDYFPSRIFRLIFNLHNPARINSEIPAPVHRQT